MTQPQLTKQQFKIFFFLYAAHIDYDFSSEEEKFIKARCSTEDYLAMHDLFLKYSDYECLRIILENKSSYLQDETERKKLYKEVITLFKIDGKYARSEKVLLEFLDKMRLTV